MSVQPQRCGKDPSTWLPSADGNRFDHLSQWAAVRTRWKLAIDLSDEAALAENATLCPNTPITVELAR
ncbi:hypothetical protein ACWFRJ_05910 [Streptomyces sp. NPDC055239]